ncbi:MAG: arylamine N-acetyltransferase [Rhizobacter sp.]|nr:arylamine N-acetyltransferase [Rhizobacter sp.]
MIDLDAYLHRICYTGPREPSFEVLSALSRLQPASIVYENIDPLLGTPPLLGLAALEDKLVARGRGGYCFEQNLLLKEALQAVGMQVTSLAARVVWMQPPGTPPRSRNHMVLRVQPASGQAGPFIVDAGFGGNLMNTPLAWQPGVAQRSPHAVLRLMQDGEWYTVETQLPTGWAAMYRFTLEPCLPVDYEPLNWFTATHHSSIFRHNLLMERLTPELRTGLFNDRLVLRRPGDAPQVRRIDTLAGFDQVMRDHFGLQLPASLIDQLCERVPKGLDQFVTPAA